MPTRWKLGFALALTTAVSWGVLPIALKIALRDMDAYTITWYRFAISGGTLALILAGTRGLPRVKEFDGRTWRLIVIGLLGLIVNYVLYLVAISYTSPATAQVVIQLGPIFLLVGGLVLFHESFSSLQWLGFATLLGGLILFFHRRLHEIIDLSSRTGVGVALLCISSLAWATYGLAQKQLTARLNPQQILLTIYIGATILLLPTAAVGRIAAMHPLPLSMLIFACLNTLLAYGAFAEALRHWSVSRVSAVLATAPLFTIIGLYLSERWVPQLLPPEGLDALSVAGALCVVGGSCVCALTSTPSPLKASVAEA